MKVIIIHGSGGNAYSNWIPWLALELKKLNIQAIVPDFPTPDMKKTDTWPGGQTYDIWKELLDVYLKSNVITNDTIWVTHSCGSVFVAKYLAERNLQALGLITVSGYDNFWEDTSPMKILNESFYTSGHSALSSICTNVKNRVNLYGEDDPFIPQKFFKNFSCAIEAKEIVVTDGGHLNSVSGYDKFEKLLGIIINCDYGSI